MQLFIPQEIISLISLSWHHENGVTVGTITLMGAAVHKATAVVDRTLLAAIAKDGEITRQIDS